MTNSSIQETTTFNAAYSPFLLIPNREQQRDIYEANRHRVYALAFWMTDSEPAAEELMVNTFSAAFSKNPFATAEEIDGALIAQLREITTLGHFTLNCADSQKVVNVRSNTLRVDLERAVVQLPATEKMIFLLHDVEGYDHARVARTLGVTENDSRLGLHQARLRMRELLAK